MPNQLVLHIQPEEGISLQLPAKVPGPVMRLGGVDMNFNYAVLLSDLSPAPAMSDCCDDCMIGDATLFQRADMVEAGWLRGQPAIGCLESAAAAQFPELSFRHLGAERG